jgi:hypothetical protein
LWITRACADLPRAHRLRRTGSRREKKKGAQSHYSEVRAPFQRSPQAIASDKPVGIMARIAPRGKGGGGSGASDRAEPSDLQLQALPASGPDLFAVRSRPAVPFTNVRRAGTAGELSRRRSPLPADRPRSREARSPPAPIQSAPAKRSDASPYCRARGSGRTGRGADRGGRRDDHRVHGERE